MVIRYLCGNLHNTYIYNVNFTIKVDLRNLNKAQLDQILNVKLKPTPPRNENRVYPVRHPVLRELLIKFNKLDESTFEDSFVYIKT